MPQSFLKGARNRSLASFLLLLGAFYVNTDVLERAWAQLEARTNKHVSYERLPISEYPHATRVELPPGVYAYTSSQQRLSYFKARFSPNCTYIHLAAIILPFMIRSVSVKRVTSGLIATVVIVGVVNFFRLHLLVFLSRSGYDWFWSHHVPHYTAYTLTIAGAVWYYYRSTVPRDVGSGAEAAADGSAQPVNA